MLRSVAEVIVPADLADALRAKATCPSAVPLAGGTDVMVAIEAGSSTRRRLLDLWGLDELRGIEATDGGVFVGGLTVYTDLIASPELNRVAPTLVEASRTVGARQIQNRGTLAGNIANASPAGDTLPVLLALDAEVEVQSAARGARRVPMREFYLGYRQTALEPDELITRIWLPEAHPGDHTHFRKVGARLAQAISKVVFAGRIRIDGMGIVTDARIAFGSVAPTPLRVGTVEVALLGRRVDPTVVAHLEDSISPIDDVRSTAAYRMRVAKNVLCAWLESLP